MPTTANQKALITAKDAAHSAALLASTSMDWDAFGKETHRYNDALRLAIMKAEVDEIMAQLARELAPQPGGARGDRVAHGAHGLAGLQHLGGLWQAHG